ncbi:MAG: hypothetical protein KI790_04475 [Cyclobacteriaceae bacterium]|nr:hypothetical protein [Cyclobacteriaceae bacterium HetDA_MAG_MS6]
MRILLSIVPVAALVALLLVSYKSEKNESINGVSLVSPPRPVEEEDFHSIANINANWVAIIPYGFSPDDDPSVYYDMKGQWWGERREGTEVLIKYAQQNNLKVMLKPHVWVRSQGWTGEYELGTEEDWKKWERSYQNYILEFAHLAEKYKVPLFCVGTEYRRVVVKRPLFWGHLIDTVSQVYSGKITYAANWDNFHNVTFWNKVDYIGVDAYFPLCEDPIPTVETIVSGWQKQYNELYAISKQYQKPILFTEYGYQSVVGAAGKHWEVDKSKLNMTAQANAYRAIFQRFWGEDWFAGGFLWKWHFSDHAGGLEDPNFTPQGKPSEAVIRQHYNLNTGR